MKKTILLLMMISSMSACAKVTPTLRGPQGILRDPNADISGVESLPLLKTPPGVPPIKSDPYYAVAGASELGSVKPVSILPPGSAVAKGRGQ